MLLSGSQHTEKSLLIKMRPLRRYKKGQKLIKLKKRHKKKQFFNKSSWKNCHQHKKQISKS